METATFKLVRYNFTKASLDLNVPQKAKLDIAFNPRGVFHSKESQYELHFDTIITCKETDDKADVEVMNVSCSAFFAFDRTISKEDIPDFFFPNCLAILFPYVRAFISTLSLQANVTPIILPIINLTGLKEELRRKTEFID